MWQARAVHGAHEGTWYYEVRMEHLGASGHVRLGWSTRKAELQTPVRSYRLVFSAAPQLSSWRLDVIWILSNAQQQEQAAAAAVTVTMLPLQPVRVSVLCSSDRYRSEQPVAAVMWADYCP